jgi:hypothetical protein
MKSMREGEEVEERQEIEPSGTVEMNPESSSQRSRAGAQGEGLLPPGLQVSECVLKLPVRRIRVEGSGAKSRRWERLPW